MNFFEATPDLGVGDASGTSSHASTGHSTPDWGYNPNGSDISPLTSNPVPFPLQSSQMIPVMDVPGHTPSPCPAQTGQQMPLLPVPNGFHGNKGYGGQSYRKGATFQTPRHALAPRSVNIGQLPQAQSSYGTSNYYAQDPSNYNFQMGMSQALGPYPNSSRHFVPNKVQYETTHYNYPNGPVAKQTLTPSYSTNPSYLPNVGEKRPITDISVDFREEYEEDWEVRPPKKSRKRPPKGPPPAYDTPAKAPESWGTVKDGFPLFKYNIFGELPVSKKYTAEEIRYYMDNCPRKFCIFVQQCPTQVAARLEAGDGRNKCMWMACQRASHRIDTGFFRVVFDEFPEETEDGTRDPLHTAGTMHLCCYEKCFDPVVDFHAGIFRADNRRLKKEELKNPIDITNKGKNIVSGAFDPWFQGRKALPHARKYEDTLSYALNEYHLSRETFHRQGKRMESEKKKKGLSITIDQHKGDLTKFCDTNKKGKQDTSSMHAPGNEFQCRTIPNMPEPSPECQEAVCESKTELAKNTTEPEQQDDGSAEIEGNTPCPNTSDPTPEDQEAICESKTEPAKTPTESEQQDSASKDIEGKMPCPNTSKPTPKDQEAISENNAELSKTSTESEQQGDASTGIEGRIPCSNTSAANETKNEGPKTPGRAEIEHETREETSREKDPSIVLELPNVEMPADSELPAYGELLSPLDVFSPPNDDEEFPEDLFSEDIDKFFDSAGSGEEETQEAEVDLSSVLEG